MDSTISAPATGATIAPSNRTPEVAPAGNTPLEYLNRRLRLEQALASLLLLVAAPLLLGCALIIALTSPGPIVYRQRRVGRGGKPFTLYKLRSMGVDAEANGRAVWCQPGDPRVTRFGRWLRWSHVDELPQLVNVLKGEMALIGPRPERPEIVSELRQDIPGYEERLRVRPGLTGLAQVSLPPDQTLQCVRRKVLLDRQYIETASRALDCHILFCTAMLVFGLRRQLPPRLWQQVCDA